ncbi:PH domain-containing protein [Streptomyces meridianus]|uniref:PH domain-containing protein n=1 Tax=Streptomyces meridianus TaxID=2938945 RepID=A0ABT0XCH6_9ACTN|nr:PH domain-containing protein [Streptomyces meridianus]MCM2580124.1 PH domain-containing protein [Streptomyces meridianus]
MTDTRDLTFHPSGKRTLWFFAGLGAAGALLAAVHTVYAGPDVVLGAGLLLALMGITALRAVTVRVSADAYGVHVRRLLRSRSMPWSDIAGLYIRLVHEWNHRSPEARRVGVVLRDGRRRLLPLVRSWTPDDPEFDAKLDALRALHRRHGTPASDHLPVVSHRTAGRGRAGSVLLCVLLLACSGAAASFVPSVAAYKQAWASAAPCTADTPAPQRAECVTTLRAVIARTERPGKRGWLYFADSRPLERLSVSQEAAREFRAGDGVELAVWRGTVMRVAGERHVWHEHVATAGSQAVVAALCLLVAGYPAATMLLRLRGRRLADDEVLPSALPFAGALAGTALWLLPFCYFHPTDPFASPAAIAWAAAGSAATLGLVVAAWRATRVRTPGEGAATGKSAGTGKGEVFLAARFLEHTDYNPHRFGTHIVLGDGPPAVLPHSGPGRFSAKRIPVERLTLKEIRRARGSDGETVPGSWHIAELDDAGTPVRLAAAPADLTRIVGELCAAETRRTP